MIMNKYIKTLALCALLGSGEAMAGFIVTQESVAPGLWTSDFYAAKAYSEANNIPMFVFWANAGCSHCEAIEKEMNKAPFLAWMSQRNMIMVFVESDFEVRDWIIEHADTEINYYPFAAVYWASNSKGEQVLKGFSAYQGNMDQLGASPNDSNIKQIVDAVDFLIPDWGSLFPGWDSDWEEDDREEIDPAEFFKKSKTISAIAYEGDKLFGIASASLGRYNAKKGMLKATFKIVSLDGKAYSKSLNVTPDKFGDILNIDVAFKLPIGMMNFNLVNNNGAYYGYGEGGDFCVVGGSVAVGGKLDKDEMLFSVIFEDLAPENDNYAFLVKPPSGASAIITNGFKLDFGAAPKLKYNRYNNGGERWYGLVEYDRVRYPNINSVKITYKSATGAFTGSFNIYASNEFSVDGGRKPTIKTYKAKVRGFVVGGDGVGKVSVKVGKKTYVGSCTLD